MFGFAKALLSFFSLILGISEMQSFPPPLSQKEEYELFVKFRGGDSRARDRLIEHNLRLVSHIIRKYYYSFQSPDELLSVGSLGLIKAVDTFKYEAGTRFATYGSKCIQNEILMFFRSRKKHSQEVSLNETIDIDKDGNPLTYLDIISAPETMADDIDMKIHIERIRTFIDTELLPREREIIVLRYGLFGFQPKTQREVAAHLSISRSYVSRIEKRALEKLEAAFGDSRPVFDS